MIEVYTDGSCLGNPGKGGWAFLVNNEGVISSRSGYSIEATNKVVWWKKFLKKFRLNL